jgi:hypothetical protein
MRLTPNNYVKIIFTYISKKLVFTMENPLNFVNNTWVLAW